ncbi:MAG: hypothetical protein JSW53_03740 [Candidatus Bathyarchaeota archaeon]|nr:MAG: hypothetical protein JSW53_03740 [Candidatus Bathyarchaeota archaeon]
MLRHGGEEASMLKRAKKPQQPTQIKAIHKELNRTVQAAVQPPKIVLSSLLNIDSYPETGKTPKINLRLYQLEELE